MPAQFDETWDEETGRELPRFLSTQPAEAARSRVSLAAVGMKLARYGTIAATAGAAICSSAYLAPENAMRRADVSANIELMPVRIVRQDSLADTALHERLSFARHFQMQRLGGPVSSPSTAPETTGSIEQVAVADDDVSSLPAVQEPVSLLLVRNLPEGTAFAEGVAAGLGVWAVGGQDAKEILAIVAKAPAQPVTADVDLIAASGATLSSQKIDIPAADTTPPVPVAAVSPLTVQEASVTAESSPLKPVKRHHRPRARTFAHATASADANDDGLAPKLKRKKRSVDDAYRNPKPAAPQVKTAQRDSESIKEEPQGPIAKFFAWLKGGAQAASQNDESVETAASSQYRGTRHGLGMAPDEK